MSEELIIVDGPDRLNLGYAILCYGESGKVIFKVRTDSNKDPVPYIFDMECLKKDSKGYVMGGTACRWYEVPVIQRTSYADEFKPVTVQYNTRSRTGTLKFTS